LNIFSPVLADLQSASHEYQHLQCETIQAMNMRQYKKLAASGMLTASFGFDDINETQLLLVTRRTAKPKYLFASRFANSSTM